MAEGGAVSHTHNHLEAAVHAKRSIEAIEFIPEVCNGLVYVCVLCVRACVCVCVYHYTVFDTYIAHMDNVQNCNILHVCRT